MPGVLREVLKVAAQEEIRVAMQKETALEIQPVEQCPTSSQPIRPRMQRREPHPRWIRSRGLSDPGTKYQFYGAGLGRIRRDRCIYAFRKDTGKDIKAGCTKKDYIQKRVPCRTSGTGKG